MPGRSPGRRSPSPRSRCQTCASTSQRGADALREVVVLQLPSEFLRHLLYPWPLGHGPPSLEAALGQSLVRLGPLDRLIVCAVVLLLLPKDHVSPPPLLGSDSSTCVETSASTAMRAFCSTSVLTTRSRSCHACRQVSALSDSRCACSRSSVTSRSVRRVPFTMDLHSTPNSAPATRQPDRSTPKACSGVIGSSQSVVPGPVPSMSRTRSP